MNENVKTCMFAAAAALIAGIAWITGPSTSKHDTTSVIGSLMFPDFKDARAVTQMEVLRFDETSRKPLPFTVAQVKNRWSIPSHSDYPADAKDHLADAATSMMGLKIIGVAPGLGDEQTDMDQNVIRKLHNDYGVIDPDAETVKTSDTGVGTRVIMKDKEGHSLLSMVIGKQAGDQSNQHWVRYTGKDPVYIVEVDPGKISSKFEDWIEKNLLKLNTMDLRQVQIRDYSIDVADDQAAETRKGQMALDYAGSGDKPWKLTEDIGFDKEGKPTVRKVADDEELDTKKLDDLKFALDDLKIVDVNRKPTGLPQDLKASGNVGKDIQGVQSLQERGFYLVPDPEKGKGHFQLLCNKGEIHLQMNDGVRYVLRFGEVTGESSQTADKAKDKKGEKKDSKKEEKKDETAPGMNRYLFVMAAFNPDAIAKPVMEPLPEEKKEAPAKKEEAKKEEGKKDEAKKDEAKKDEKKKDEAKKDEKKPDLKVERERIEKENKRKQEEYDGQVAKGKDHVKELNGRFADWYYVISDDVYRKIHLGRDQIVKKKEKAKDAKDKDSKEAGHDHDHEADHDHDHDHDHDAEKKPGPVGELENLKQSGPEGEKK